MTSTLALPARNDVWRLALVVPQQGPAGIIGPSCEAVAELAARELNTAGGILGREVEIEIVDGAAGPTTVARRIEELMAAGAIDAISGWHTSDIRNTLAPMVSGRIPYAYTALYEGGETHPGVYCTGETPQIQLEPAMRWMRDFAGIRKWFVVGSDYVWPRDTMTEVRKFAGDLGLELVGGAFVPVGGAVTALVERVAQADCQAVLMLLLGQDAVRFNRTFAHRGLDTTLMRFSPLMDENMLLATGAANTTGLMSAAGFFDSQRDADAADLHARYTALHGRFAPVIGGPAESCYEGIRLLSSMIERTGSFTAPAMAPALDGTAYSGPRGTVEFRHAQARQHIHLAVANGSEFEVVTDF
ncbi:substrate-binding domain-containing protein [Nocardia stercoris]|uniref:Leucine-binding protein domain-containing protein n=1 Tax=Nocardia stercoris TaxID=2483361 RepID=A0A3M2LKC2_9NOCA|nr:substrate-binding domain-containing protein [Nocardia stercoris]RMI35218.1 hypothetical protein EBN03_02695 [Nocardia stercoris]